MWAPEFLGFWVEPNAATWRTDRRTIVPQPVPTITIADIDATDLLDSLEIVTPWNGKASCSFILNNTYDSARRIADRQSNLCPPGYGAWAGKVRQHNRTEDRLIEITVTQAGETRVFPSFLPGQVGSFSGQQLAWGGEDKTALLEVEDQRMDDLIADAGDNTQAIKMMRDTGEEYGVTVDCLFADYKMRECRRQGGTPLQWMDKAAKTRQAGRRWRKDRLVYEAARVDDGPRFTFVDRLNIKTLDFGELDRPKNQFTIVRFESRGAELTDIPPMSGGSNVIKRHNISLTSPARAAQLVVLRSSPGGVPNESITWYDASDNVIGSGKVYVGNAPAARVEFNFVPTIYSEGGAYVPYLDISIRGGTTSKATTENFNYTRSDETTVNAQGLNPEYKSIESEIIYDAPTALECVVAHVRESVRRAWRAKFETPYLCPFLEPGMNIRITDYKTRMDGLIWFVERVIYRWQQRKWSMVLECTRGVF